MNIRSVLCLLIMLFVVVGKSQSATIECSKRGEIKISGEIVEGDGEKLAQYILQNQDKNCVLGVILDSNGGLISESLKMSALISGEKMEVHVDIDKTCASSCFLLYLAGEPRHAANNTSIYSLAYGRIGLHRPYMPKEFFDSASTTKTTNAQASLMEQMTAYLNSQNVPSSLIEKMMSRSSSEIYWLSDSEISALGEVSPPREELLIAKCKYKRNETFDLLFVGNPKIDQIRQCVMEIQASERSSFISRLRSGWRPWLIEQEVKRKLVRLYASPKMTMYLDENSISIKNNVIRYSKIMQLKDAQTGPNMVIGSMVYIYQINCHEMTDQQLQSAAYSGFLGNGEFIDFDDRVGRLEKIEKGDIEYKLLCKK